MYRSFNDLYWLKVIADKDCDGGKVTGDVDLEEKGVRLLNDIHFELMDLADHLSVDAELTKRLFDDYCNWIAVGNAYTNVDDSIAEKAEQIAKVFHHEHVFYFTCTASYDGLYALQKAGCSVLRMTERIKGKTTNGETLTEPALLFMTSFLFPSDYEESEKEEV